MLNKKKLLQTTKDGAMNIMVETMGHIHQPVLEEIYSQNPLKHGLQRVFLFPKFFWGICS